MPLHFVKKKPALLRLATYFIE